MIGRNIPHYRILEKLGAGGMGAVCKAESISLRRFVALKFLPEAVSTDRQGPTPAESQVGRYGIRKIGGRNSRTEEIPLLASSGEPMEDDPILKKACILPIGFIAAVAKRK